MLLLPDVKSIRANFKKAGLASRTPLPLPPLKNILMVGAKTEQHAKSTILSFLDEVYLEKALEEVTAQGIAIAPDFKVKVANIDSKFGGKDFLKGQCRADLLVICYIMDAPRIDPRLFELFKGQLPASQNFGKHHREENIWYKKACAAKAKAIFIVGGDTEVTEENFRGENFSKPIARSMLNDRMPCDLLVDKTYLKAIKSTYKGMNVIVSGKPTPIWS